MDGKHKGILMFAAAILSIGLLFGAPNAKAADGDLNAAGIVLKDTNANGKIDEVQITVDYAAGTANALSHAVNLATTIGKFTVTDTTTGNPVTVSSIDFVSGNGTVAVFKLVLNEADTDLSVNTSATALNVVYDATGSDLKITNGTTPVNVAAILTGVVEKDGARPIILTAVDQSAIPLNLDSGTNIPANANIVITFSEPMDTASLDAAGEWTISPDPAFWALPVWSNSNKTVTLSHTSAFAAGSAETVTLAAPLAISGASAADKALQNIPIAAAVNNPFTFTVAGVVDTAVSASQSTVAASPSSPAVNQTSTVTVTVKNSAGAVLSGKTVTISSSRATDTIATVAGTTGADGIATFTVKSTLAGASVITAKAGDATLTQTPTINFIEEGSDICSGPATPNYHSGVTLYRIPGDHRVYVVKNKKKHWIKSVEEFNESCYDWSKIQAASAALLAKYPEAETLVSELLRAVGDPRVYIIENGKKRWIKSAEEFNAAGYDWSNIKDVTPDTLAAYTDAQLADALVKIVNAMNLRVRSADSAGSAVLDTVNKNEVYTVIEKKNGWYKIKTKHGKEGWVSGKYAVEEDEDEEDED